MINDILEFTSGYKTYISLALLILVCGAEKLGIDVVSGIDATNAATVAWGAITAAFMRSGIAKSEAS